MNNTELKSPDSVSSALFFLIIPYIFIGFMYFKSEFNIASAKELLVPSNIYLAVIIGSLALVPYKISKGKNWARLYTIFMQGLLLVVLLFAFFMNPDAQIALYKHFPYTSILAFVGAIFPIYFLQKKDSVSWFKRIREQTPLKDRTREFILGYTFLSIIYAASQYFYEISIFNFVNNTYGAEDSLTYIQAFTYQSNIVGNTKGQILTQILIYSVALLLTLCAYYLIVFIIFGFIFGKTKKAIGVASDFVSPNNSAKRINTDLNDNNNYILAYREVEIMEIENEALWVKAYAMSEGNEEKQKSIYVKLRAEELDENY